VGQVSESVSLQRQYNRGTLTRCSHLASGVLAATLLPSLWTKTLSFPPLKKKSLAARLAWAGFPVLRSPAVSSSATRKSPMCSSPLSPAVSPSPPCARLGFVSGGPFPVPARLGPIRSAGIFERLLNSVRLAAFTAHPLPSCSSSDIFATRPPPILLL